MSRIRFLTVLLGASVFTVQAYAATPVTVRSSIKDDYTRIVFEWPTAPSYVTDKTASAITLKFMQDGDFKISGAAPSSVSRVTSYKADAKNVTIGFQGGEDVRHFAIGNKVIVDIRGPEKEPPKKDETKPDVKEEPAKAEAKPQEAAVVAPPITEAKPELKKAEAPKSEPEPKKPELKKIEPAAAPVEDKAVKAAVDATQKDITVNIAGASDIAVAAFTRLGQFWIVVDQPNFATPPQASGKNAKEISFSRVDLPNATAFHAPLPVGAQFHTEGGGKLWSFRTIPQTKKDNLSIVALTRVADQNKTALLWPVASAHAPIEMTDPLAGDTISVIPVASATASVASSFIEVATLGSYAGLAVDPKSDAVKVEKTAEGILIHTGEGLKLGPEVAAAVAKPVEAKPAEQKAEQKPEDIPLPTADEAAAKPVETAAAQPMPTTPSVEETQAVPVKSSPHASVYDFSPWKNFTPEQFVAEKRAMLLAAATKSPLEQARDLVKLAKSEMSRGHGPEAHGFLELAGQIAPDLITTTEFKALEGLAAILNGDGETALKNFSDEAVKSIADAAVLKPYALALLEDWKQAGDALPADLSLLNNYPDPLRLPVTLALAEVALRAGKAKQADLLLATLNDPKTNLSLPYQSAYDYLRGESQRQQKQTDLAIKEWERLRNGTDDLYRAKAGLALTGLQLDQKKITPEQAIDRLEGLRFAWRGDQLETAINFLLGKSYVANNEPEKALTILGQAKDLTPESDISENITTYMASTFKDLFTPAKIKKLDPVDATTLYDEFSFLAPEGPEKQAITRQLAERLVDADLLGRAAGLLKGLVDSGKLSAGDNVDVGLRLASIQLLDTKPQAALATLDKVDAAVATLPADDVAVRKREATMLRAQALSDEQKPDNAFTVLDNLEQTADVLRLRADIAWTAQRWQAAADALEELSKVMEISPTRPVTDEQGDILVNWAVALYLADNKAVLANLREVYSNAMAASPKAKQFEVVTRPQQSGMLTDKDTINQMIDETEIFKGFLESFSAKAPNPAKAASEPAPVPAKAASTAPVAAQ